MRNARTNSLDRKLSPEIRAQINSDLVERPPGRATLQEVYDHYRLREHGISWGAFGRHAKYIRLLHRNYTIRKLADKVTDVDGLSAKNAALIRTRLFEVLTDEDSSPSDILNLVIADSTAVRTAIKSEEWEIQRQKVEAALAQSRRDAQRDPDLARHNLEQALRDIYGIQEPRK